VPRFIDLRIEQQKGNPLKQEVDKAETTGFDAMTRDAETMTRANRELLEWRHSMGVTVQPTDRLIQEAA
jgi:hypothetical protein